MRILQPDTLGFNLKVAVAVAVTIAAFIAASGWIEYESSRESQARQSDSHAAALSAGVTTASMLACQHASALRLRSVAAEPCMSAGALDQHLTDYLSFVPSGLTRQLVPRLLASARQLEELANRRSQQVERLRSAGTPEMLLTQQEGLIASEATTIYLAAMRRLAVDWRHAAITDAAAAAAQRSEETLSALKNSLWTSLGILLLTALMAWLLHRSMLKPFRMLRAQLAEDAGIVANFRGDRLKDIEQLREQLREEQAGRVKAQNRIALLGRAVEVAATGVVMTDALQPDHPIVYVNRRFTEITGYSAEDAIGQNPRFLQGEDRDQPELQAIRSVIANGSWTEQMLRNYRKDGSPFVNMLRLSAVRDAEGQVTHFVGLQADVTEWVESRARHERLQAELVAAARRVGMGEVAAGVLHNVGNSMNSLGVSVQTLRTQLRASRLPGLARACDLLDEHRKALPHFLTEDLRGQQLPGYLRELCIQLEREQLDALRELESVRTNLEHVERTITLHQSVASSTGLAESLDLAELLEVALGMSFQSLPGIEIEREFQALAPQLIDRHRLMQVLLNVLQNAREAVLAPGLPERRIRISLRGDDEVDGIEIEVTDYRHRHSGRQPAEDLWLWLYHSP